MSVPEGTVLEYFDRIAELLRAVPVKRSSGQVSVNKMINDRCSHLDTAIALEAPRSNPGGKEAVAAFREKRKRVAENN